MEYTVTYAIRGYYDVEIEAENASEAEQKANEIILDKIIDGDFGELIDPQEEVMDVWMK